jgi:hypothetical protein
MWGCGQYGAASNVGLVGKLSPACFLPAHRHLEEDSSGLFGTCVAKFDGPEFGFSSLKKMAVWVIAIWVHAAAFAVLFVP